MSSPDQLLWSFDPELWGAIDAERARRDDHVDLLATGNHASPRVLAAQASVLAGLHAADRRHPDGRELYATVERLATERCRQLFGAAYANVQPHSGSMANHAVCAALLAPGEVILGMSPAHGGRFAYGSEEDAAGSRYQAVTYGVDANAVIDYAGVEALARTHRPRLIVAGTSAYALRIDFKRFRRIADSVGAFLMVDMAHHAGPVAAGLYPSPVGVADAVTGTTHMTLRGPRGGFILATQGLGDAIDAAVGPTASGTGMLPVIAAKAVAFLEAASPEFRAHLERVFDNAATLARALEARGLRIVAGRTECHIILVDLHPHGIAGAEAGAALKRAHITVDPVAMASGSPTFADNGVLRLGTLAATTRGFGPVELEQLAHVVADVIVAPRDDAVIARSAAAVADLCARFPVDGRPLVPPVSRARPSLVVAR